jgi:hypothetical protein
MKLKFTQKAMRKKLTKLLAVFMIMAFLSSVLPVSVFALPSYSLETCIVNLPVFADWRTLEFATFLDMHFQNKDSNTSLMSDAIDAYKAYKDTISTELGKYQVGDTTTDDQLKALDSCIRYADQKILEAKDMLIKHAATVSRIKQQTILLEKYQAINNKLDAMNMLISKILGTFTAFKEKLPGFLKDCNKKK